MSHENQFTLYSHKYSPVGWYTLPSANAIIY